MILPVLLEVVIKPFQDRVIIITGGGYGIGAAIARAFAAQGGNLVLAARSKEKLDAVAAECRRKGVKALSVTCDVAVEQQVQAMTQKALNEFGRIDVLVNNAGIAGPTAAAKDVSLADWQQTLDINLTGAFLCAREVIPIMTKAGGGTIVNIGSIASRIGYSMRAPYAAAKWGLLGLNHTLAVELGPHNIRVNAVLPGPVAGERIERVVAARAEASGKSKEAMLNLFIDPMPLGRLPTEDNVAQSVLFFASDAAESVTGQVVNVDSGYHMH